MSTIQLSQDIEVEPAQIATVQLERRGAKISSKVVSVASGDFQDLRVPEDSLIVRLQDGAEFVIRGEAAAQQAYDQLKQVKEREKLGFELGVTESS